MTADEKYTHLVQKCSVKSRKLNLLVDRLVTVNGFEDITLLSDVTKAKSEAQEAIAEWIDFMQAFRKSGLSPKDEWPE